MRMQARAGGWLVSLARRGRLGAACAALALLACMVPAGAQETDTRAEAQVEAAFLVNFVRYTDWPPEVFATPDAPYVITVLGSEDVAETMRRLTRVVPPVRGRRIEVQRMEFPPGADAIVRTALSERLRRSHLVFVQDSRESVSAILGDLSGQPVLTVSDRDDFVAQGGMLGLRRSGGRFVFDANPAAIRNARLVVSAKVLKLATLVEGVVR
jgi:hypothetical protein